MCSVTVSLPKMEINLSKAQISSCSQQSAAVGGVNFNMNISASEHISSHVTLIDKLIFTDMQQEI